MKISVNEQEKRLIYKNFYCYFSWMLGAKKYQDCTYTQPNVPFVVFNSVIETKLNEQNCAKVIKDIKECYQHKPFCWWLTDFTSPHLLNENLEKAGFERGSSFVGMIYSLAHHITIPDEIANIQVKEVTDQNLLDDWIKPMQKAFGIDDMSTRYCLKVFKESINDKRLKHYYVEDKGKIVGTGTLFIEDNVSGFYNMAVVPEYRNRKIATAIKWHRLKVSHELGAKNAILQSSTMGRALDMRIGFKPVSEFIPYFLPQA